MADHKVGMRSGDWSVNCDVQGGVVLLTLALFLHTGYTRAFKRLSIEYAGARRVWAAVHVCATIVTTPLAVIALAVASQVAQFGVSSIHVHFSHPHHLAPW